MTDLNNLFAQNTSIMAASLDEVLQPKINEYEKLRDAGEKGELAYINISLLLSGILYRLPWLRLDLLDKKHWADASKCYTEWDVPYIADNLYMNAENIAKENKKIKEYELEQNWLDASSEYYAAFEQYLPAVINQCAAAKTISCHWHFGQFLGHTITVWSD